MATQKISSTFGLRRILLAVLLVPVLFMAWIGLRQVGLNWHEVAPGVYRSAQPSASDVGAVSARYGIKTIINLRGENTGQAWYDAEVAAARAAGVRHVDFRMSSKRPLSEAQARELVALMRDAPKPLWVHCRGGADRSALAAALYLLGQGVPAEKADNQLSPYYGHVALPVHKGYEMDRSFERLAPQMPN